MILNSKYNVLKEAKEKILIQKNKLLKKSEDKINLYLELTLKYGEIMQKKQNLQALNRNKLSKINLDMEEKNEKTKTFNKNLEDKFHTLQNFKNIMITFHQQLETESKKMESKRYKEKI